jgi:glycerate 2-kinase
VSCGASQAQVDGDGSELMADLKQLARRIFYETLAAIDIPATMHRKLRRVGPRLQGDSVDVDLRSFERVCVIAIGKAAHAMVEGLAALLGESVRFEGVVVAPTAPARALSGTQYFAAGHPLPNAQSWQAAVAILAALKTCNERTLVFFLLSGGGSALVELPLDPELTLDDLQQVYRVLVTCGAPIADIGKVRRHISAVKGGRLAVAAGRATKITLAVSDVPAGQEPALGSGTTIPDPTTITDAMAVLRHYGIEKDLPAALRRWIQDGKMPETPKPGESAFSNACFSLLLGTDDLFHPAHHAAEAAGCVTCCDNTTDDWLVERAADYLLEQLEEFRRAHPGRRAALIAGGEVSSPVTGSGVGGRNSAFVLACVERIAGARTAVLSAGTDGVDGNSPAAGAVADGTSAARAQALRMKPQDFFMRSDAYSFFSRLDDVLVTGPTGNNLRDLRILIAEPGRN